MRHRTVTYSATLLDLMRAYARIRTKDEFRPFVMDRQHVYTMEQALDRLREVVALPEDDIVRTDGVPADEDDPGGGCLDGAPDALPWLKDRSAASLTRV